MPRGESYGGIFSIESPSSQMALACVKFIRSIQSYTSLLQTKTQVNLKRRTLSLPSVDMHWEIRTRNSVGSLPIRIALVKMLMFRTSFCQYYKNKAFKAIVISISMIVFSFYNHLQSVKKNKNKNRIAAVAVWLTWEVTGVCKTQQDLLMTFSEFSFKDLGLNLITEDSGVQFAKQTSLWVHQVENLYHKEVLFYPNAQWEAIAAWWYH